MGYNIVYLLRLMLGNDMVKILVTNLHVQLLEQIFGVKILIVNLNYASKYSNVYQMLNYIQYYYNIIFR